MIKIDEKTLSLWAEFWSAEDTQSAKDQYASFRMEMSDEEKEGIDLIIARAQLADDPHADTTDAGIVTRCLIDNGYHPAFEFEAVISGQEAFDRLRAESASSLKP